MLGATIVGDGVRYVKFCDPMSLRLNFSYAYPAVNDQLLVYA